MIQVLDKGYVTLTNIAGPWGKADDCDPARAARVSFNTRTARPENEDLRLVNYLWEHRHTTPFEMIEVWLEMKLPIFVARHLVKHRTTTINEVSRRYVVGELEFYNPTMWRAVAANKKQGSLDTPAEGISFEKADLYTRYVQEKAVIVYNKLIDGGVCPEQARIVLPQSLYTTWLWKQNFKNIMHMLALRMDDHSQWETRQFAFATHKLLCQCLPKLMNVIERK